MNSADEFVLLGGVIKALNDASSWCGETHIQKSCYIAKHLKAVAFQSRFILYKHGPFSFDLSTTLNVMRAQGVVRVIPRKMGSSYDVNLDLWQALEKSSGNLFAKYDEHIVPICSALAKKNVAELERVATAVYVCLNYPKIDRSHKISQLRELKPHIGEDDARLAFIEASHL